MNERNRKLMKNSTFYTLEFDQRQVSGLSSQKKKNQQYQDFSGAIFSFSFSKCTDTEESQLSSSCLCRGEERERETGKEKGGKETEFLKGPVRTK